MKPIASCCLVSGADVAGIPELVEPEICNCLVTLGNVDRPNPSTLYLENQALMTIAQRSRSAVLIYEDRQRCEIGIRLLVASLIPYLSGTDIHLFAPNATASLRKWLAARPIVLHEKRIGELGGCDIKPAHFLWMLDQGYQRIVWFDSDMILTQAPPKLLMEAPDDVLVASQLPRRSQFITHEHTAGWDLPLGRRFRRVPSNCCMSVTAAHRSLLEQWRTMSASERYQYWQTQPRNDRPLCFRGSDAVFLSLLGSKPYETLDIRLLRSGRDIAQCVSAASYTPDERLASLIFGLPAIIHAMGIKPWLASGDNLAYESISPYTCVARTYADALEGQQPWLTPATRRSQAWHDLVQGHPALATLPQAIRDWLKQLGLRSTVNTIRYNLGLDNPTKMLNQ